MIECIGKARAGGRNGTFGGWRSNGSSIRCSRWCFREYVDTVMEARRLVAGLEGQMREVLEQWSLRPMVEALIALRGVDVVTAMTVLAELGDMTRFDSPRRMPLVLIEKDVMDFLGVQKPALDSLIKNGTLVLVGGVDGKRKVTRASLLKYLG